MADKKHDVTLRMRRDWWDDYVYVYDDNAPRTSISVCCDKMRQVFRCRSEFIDVRVARKPFEGCTIVSTEGTPPHGLAPWRYAWHRVRVVLPHPRSEACNMFAYLGYGASRFLRKFAGNGRIGKLYVGVRSVRKRDALARERREAASKEPA